MKKKLWSIPRLPWKNYICIIILWYIFCLYIFFIRYLFSLLDKKSKATFQVRDISKKNTKERVSSTGKKDGERNCRLLFQWRGLKWSTFERVKRCMFLTWSSSIVPYNHMASMIKCTPCDLIWSKWPT